MGRTNNLRILVRILCAVTVFGVTCLLLNFQQYLIHSFADSPGTQLHLTPSRNDTLSFVYINQNGFKEGDVSQDDVSFHVTVQNNSFSVASNAPLQNKIYSLFARLNSGDDKHFACHMQLRCINSKECPEFICPDLEHLEPGELNVTVLLVRRQKHNISCTNLSGRTYEDDGKDSAWLRISDYVIANEMKLFEDVLNCFSFSYQKVLNFEWSHSHAIRLKHAKPRCTSESAGRWVNYNTLDSKELWEGRYDADLLASRINTDRGMHHMFAPFNCRYKIHSVNESLACMHTTQPVFFGDSRDSFLRSHLAAWLDLKNNSGPLTNVWWPNTSYGMAYALSTSERRQSLTEMFRSWLDKNRTLVLDSLLHDFAHYNGKTLVKDIISMNPGTHQCSECKADYVGQCSETSLCRQKTFAVHAYRENIERLQSLLASAKRTHPHARIFWLSHHRRAPVPGEHLHPWQTEDLMYDLQEYAAEVMQAANIDHIDLRPLLTTAPGHWWDDAAHYGREPGNLLKHVSFQIILNRICP